MFAIDEKKIIKINEKNNKMKKKKNISIQLKRKNENKSNQQC